MSGGRATIRTRSNWMSTTAMYDTRRRPRGPLGNSVGWANTRKNAPINLGVFPVHDKGMRGGRECPSVSICFTIKSLNSQWNASPCLFSYSWYAGMLIVMSYLKWDEETNELWWILWYPNCVTECAWSEGVRMAHNLYILMFWTNGEKRGCARHITSTQADPSYIAMFLWE